MIDTILRSNFSTVIKLILIYCVQNLNITHSTPSLSVALKIVPRTVRNEIATVLKPTGIFVQTDTGVGIKGNVYPIYTFNDARLKEIIDTTPSKKKFKRNRPAATLAAGRRPAATLAVISTSTVPVRTPINVPSTVPKNIIMGTAATLAAGVKPIMSEAEFDEFFKA